MRKKSILMILAALLLLPASLWAQETVVVGTGTDVSTNFYAPSQVNFRWQYTQILYTPDMIGSAGSISSVAWMPAAGTFTRTFRILMGNSSQQSFNGTFVAASELTEVFQGQVSFSANQWGEIELDVPFDYDGVSNLLVAIEDQTGQMASSYYKWVSTPTTDTLCTRQSSDQTAYTAENPPSSTTYLYPIVPNMQISITEGGMGDFCYPAASIAASEVGENEVTITVNENADHAGGSYVLQYKIATASWDDENAVTEVSMSGLTEIVTGLDGATAYTFRVRRDCGDNYSTWRTITVTTACGVVTTFPWSETFESDWVAQNVGLAAPNCWHVFDVNNDGDKWERNTSGINGGSANINTDYNSSNNDWLITPQMQLDGNKQLRFKARNYSATTSEQDEVAVYISDEDLDTFAMPSVNTGNIAGFTQVYQTLLPVGPAAEYEVSLAGYSGVRYLAFVRKESPADGWRLFIDDIVVEDLPTCSRPAIMTITPTETSATITWTSTGASFIIKYKESGASAYTELTEFESTDNGYSATIEGLNSSTSYEVIVVAVCEDETQQMSNPSTFRTDCGAIANLPWTEGFEGFTAETEPECWSHLTPSTSSLNYCRVYNSSSTSHTGSRCLRFNYAVGNNIMLLPPFEVEINTLEISFWHRPESNTNQYCGTLQVGYLTDAGDASTFVPVASYAYTDFANTDYRMDDVTFAGAPEGARMAFCHVSASSVTGTSGYNWFWHVDDIDVHVAPSCTRPVVSVSGLTESSATLAISDANDMNNYKLFIAGQDTIELSVNEYTIDNLTAATAYSVQVYTVCDDGTMTNATTVNFTTQCAAEAFPFHFTQADMLAVQSAGFTEPCWDWNGYYRSTSNGVGYVYSSGASTEFRLPAVDVDLSTAQLRTMVACTSAGCSFRVGVRDGNVTTWVDTIAINQTASTTAGEYYEVALTGYTGTGKRVVVGNLSSSNVYFLDFHVEQQSSCPAVGSLHVVDVMDTSVEVSWNAGNEESQWIVYINGVEAGTVSETSFSVDTLSPSSPYSISVRALCGDGDTSSERTVSFRTACGTIGTDDLPLTENFDSYASATQQIDCWTRLSNWSYPQVSSSAATTVDDENVGTMVYYSYTYSAGDAIYFASPRFESLEGLLASCYVRQISSGSILTIGVMSNPSDGNTFVPITTFNAVSNWTLVEAYMSEVDSIENYHYVGFRQTMTSGTGGLFIDNIYIGMPSTCPKPQNIVLDDISENEATISWIHPGEAGSYIVTYTVGGVEHTETVNEASITLTGLSASSTYTISVSAVCGDDDSSLPVSFTFKTPCGAINEFPWEENFDEIPTSEQGNIVSHGYQYLNCWNMKTGIFNAATGTSNATDATYDAFYLMNSNVMGSTHIRVNIYGTDQYRWLVTPPMSIGSEGSLSFRYALTGYNNSNAPSSVDTDDKFYVLASTDGSTWSKLYAWGGDTTDFDALLSSMPSTPDSISIDLGEYANQTIFIAFYSESITGGSDNDIHLDDIRVMAEAGETPGPGPQPQPETCNTPTNLHSTATTQTSVTIDWTAGGSENQWQLQVDGGQPVSVSAHPHTLNGLTVGTTYSVKVRAVCGEGNYSDWSASVNVSTDTADTPGPGPDGIEDAAAAVFGLYPNPASTTVRVDVNGEARIAIIDQSGRTVAAVNAAGSTDIDVSQLAKGAYYVRVSTADATAIRKLVVR